MGDTSEFQFAGGFHVKKPSKSVLVSKQPTQQSKAEELEKEVSATYDRLKQIRQKIIDSDDQFSDITIHDLVVKNVAEFILVLASRMKAKQQKQSEYAKLMKNTQKLLR